MTTPLARPSPYSHPNSWEQAERRLRSLERVYDPGTVRRLDDLGVGTGRRWLEVGAGAGSIARWMCSKAGPTGRVLAIDLDTCLLKDLRAPNLDVACLDLRTDELPRESFDVIHARAVLTHMPEREAVLDAMVAALAPGGWLLVEDADAPASLGRCSGVHARMMRCLIDCLTEAGADWYWAPDLPARLGAHGLADVGGESDCPLMRGGSAGVDLYTLTVVQMREQFLAAGATAADLDDWVAHLRDARFWIPGLALTAAWGRKR